MGQQRFTRQQAAKLLEVSLTTVDRMVRRGDLQMERDGPGERARVWVLLDDEYLVQHLVHSVHLMVNPLVYHVKWKWSS